MAGAPTKESLNFFPLDVGTLNDRKFRKAKTKYGSISVLIYIALLDLIYGDKGYYIEYSENTKDDVIWDILNILQGAYQPKAETIEEVIELLVACGLFSDDQFNNKILTSVRVQETYYKITVERKIVNVNFDYWLLSKEQMQELSSKSVVLQNFINRSINSINQPINSINQPINEQSKVKESKVKESKVNYNVEILDVVEFLNSTLGTSYNADEQATKDFITARLNEGFKVEDFKTVIQRKTEEWLYTGMAKYLRPETLFGDKFGRYLNEPAVLSKKQPYVLEGMSLNIPTIK